MVRNIGAVILGLIVGMAVNMGFVILSSALFPMPEGTDMADPAQMSAYFDTLPLAAFLLILVAHLGQAAVGGWVAARLGASRPVVPALIVGALSMLGGIANAMMMPLPTWMYVEIPLYLVVAYGAGMVEARRRAGLAGG